MKFVCIQIFLIVVFFSCTQTVQNTRNKMNTINVNQSKIDSCSYYLQTLAADSICAFKYDGEEQDTTLDIANLKNQTLHSTARKVKKLTQKDMQTLIQVFSQLCDSKDVQVSKCYEPHHGFVFYRNGKMIHHFSICFTCNNYHSSLKLPSNFRAGFTPEENEILYKLF